MVCPFCAHSVTRVYNSRRGVKGPLIWRRRRCAQCQEVFTTYEVPDLAYIRITKRNGTLEPYARIKLYSSIYRAHLDPLESDALTSTIERKLLQKRLSMLQSREIAEVAQATLRAFSEPSYARYRSFQT